MIDALVSWGVAHPVIAIFLMVYLLTGEILSICWLNRFLRFELGCLSFVAFLYGLARRMSDRIVVVAIISLLLYIPGILLDMVFWPLLLAFNIKERRWMKKIGRPANQKSDPAMKKEVLISDGSVRCSLCQKQIVRDAEYLRLTGFASVSLHLGECESRFARLHRFSRLTLKEVSDEIERTL